MANSITCPQCKRVISNHPMIDSAARLEDTASQSLICECGNRITNWAIAAQLRKQKTLGWKIGNWFKGLGRGGKPS